MIDQDKLDDLLDRWEEARERGEELSANDLCRECPELENEVAARIRALKATDWMMAGDDEQDLDVPLLPPAESLSAHAVVPASVTLDQFTTSITLSGVMSADELTRFEASDAQDLAAHLLRGKRLTEYQAKMIAEGKTSGLVLGNYVILDKIGAGGMGQVFKARHRRMDRVVALKVLPKESVDSPIAVDRFHQEVRAAAKLEHPNIVTAHDADESEGTHFLVMQYVDGQDLASLVRTRGPMSVAHAVDCVIQAAKGLQYAHGVGVVHRDIKPANLLLGSEGTVKILDMGLARLEKTNGGNGNAVTEAQLTQDGAVMGTVDFMSPEQAMDTHNADARSDIYSLGCTLFYLLTGMPMYRKSSLMAKMMADKEADIPVLHVEREGVPGELSAVFERMVAKEPEDRYPTVAALLADLEEVADGLDDDESDMETTPPQETALEVQSTETSSASYDQTIDLQDAAKPDAKQSPLPVGEGQGEGSAADSDPRPRGQLETGIREGADWRKLVGVAVAVLALAIVAGVIFTIKMRDGVIRIETNVPDVGGDIQRRVAEWVLSVGGAVRLWGESANTESRDDLPSEPFHIMNLSLKGYKELDEAALDMLAKLPSSVNSLRLDDTNLADSDLKYLAGSRVLHLYLSGTKVSDAGLDHLNRLPRLGCLHLNSTAITDNGLKHLERLKTLPSIPAADGFRKSNSKKRATPSYKRARRC